MAGESSRGDYKVDISGGGWRSRIVGHGEASPGELTSNPRNWRKHPKAQRDALAAVLDRVGWVQDVIVNRTTGHLVDGHARLDLARQRGEASVPVVYVELDADEEALVLATLDPLAAMAEADTDALADLLAAITSDDAALTSMLAALALESGFVPEVGFPALPEGERGIRQMTFTVTADQQATIEGAIGVARRAVTGDTGNENGNGNALALICEGYAG